MFSKNIRTIYLYLICLITLFMVIGGLISTIYNVTEYIFPNNYYRIYGYDYIDSKEFENEPVSAQEYEEYIKMQEIDRLRDEQNNKRQDLKNIIYSATICIVALPVYLYNWRKIEKERTELKETESAGE